MVATALTFVVGGVGTVAQAGEVPVLSSSGTTPKPTGDGRLAFVHESKIFTMLPDGSGKQRLTTGGSSGPSWSPDGLKIAYVQESEPGVRNLWIMAADGSGKVQVTTSGGVAPGAPAWSPDGLRLAFGGPCMPIADDPDMCVGNEGRPTLDTIGTIAPFGEPTTAVATSFSGPADGPMDVIDRVAWAPGGEQVAFYTRSVDHADDQYIVMLDLATGGGEIIYSIGAHGVTGRLGYPAFSHNGSRVAFDADYDVMGEPAARGILTCPFGELRGACGGSFKQVEGDSQIVFAPSGKQVALLRVGNQDRIFLAATDGTSRRLLTRGSQPSWQPLPA